MRDLHRRRSVAAFLAGLVLAVLVASSSAQTTVVVRRPAAATSCPNNTGNLINETFDAAGYDLTWTEIRANNGIVDEDNTTNPPLTSTCFDGEQLRIVNSTDGFSRQGVRYNNSARADIQLWFRFWVYVDDYNGTTPVMLFSAASTTTQVDLETISLWVDDDGGSGIEFSMSYGALANDRCVGSHFSATRDTAYLVDVRVRATTGASSKAQGQFWVNGTSICNWEHNDDWSDLGKTEEIEYFWLWTGIEDTSVQSAYFDNFGVDTAARIGN